MAARVQVDPRFFPWAVERARGDWEAFVARFAKLPEWVEGKSLPTYKQLEKFAAATHAPLGFFFLRDLPEEPLPVTDFRTLGGAELGAPSADLLDTIYGCQDRQDWYREFSRSIGEEAIAFVGSLSTETDPVTAAATIAQTLGFRLEDRKASSSWSEALRTLVQNCEEAGILVMISGIVGNNTRRRLNPSEFRGFCLPDERAPVVFVNGADSKSAQMFTLVHEVAHLWLGEGGVSNRTLSSRDGPKVEVWCNAVAAEVLVPLVALRAEFHRHASLEEEVRRLCRVFKVSSLVVLRRLFDAGFLTREQFDAQYGAEIKRLRTLQSERSSGGDFYNTEGVRVSRRFARALLLSTFEGNTLFRDASRLLGIKKTSTFNEFATRLRVF